MRCGSSERVVEQLDVSGMHVGDERASFVIVVRPVVGVLHRLSPDVAEQCWMAQDGSGPGDLLERAPSRPPRRRKQRKAFSIHSPLMRGRRLSDQG